jgi:thioredoxin reductase
VTHTSAHADLSVFRGREVIVIGAGASAVDTAAILYEQGAKVQLTGRAPRVEFHDKSNEPRPLIDRILNPRSGLGIGWRSRLATDAPMVFHLLPRNLRLRVVKRHLGPAPGWFAKDKMIGKVPMHMGVELKQAEVRGKRVHLSLAGTGGTQELVADHVIAGTGYRPSLDRLALLDGDLRRSISDLMGTPILSQSFESSVPGLYFVGLASANAFGPLMRFAFGARYTAKTLARHLARRASA